MPNDGEPRTRDEPQRHIGALDELIHAVVNALNTIAAASELTKLLLERSEATDIAKPLASIEPECMRAARLLREGRDFMNFEVAASRKPVDLAALLDACAEDFDGRVQIGTRGTLRPVAGDAAALRRLVMEILGNAFQFGAQRVEVTLDADAGAELQIDFRDDGPGVAVPPARLFMPFFSTMPDEHSGLGLALVRRIALAHGGFAGVDATARGAAFWVKLPMGEA